MEIGSREYSTHCQALTHSSFFVNVSCSLMPSANLYTAGAYNESLLYNNFTCQLNCLILAVFLRPTGKHQPLSANTHRSLIPFTFWIAYQKPGLALKASCQMHENNKFHTLAQHTKRYEEQKAKHIKRLARKRKTFA